MIAEKLKSRKNWLLPLERRLGDQDSLNQLLVKFLVSFMLREDINSRKTFSLLHESPTFYDPDSVVVFHVQASYLCVAGSHG